MEGYADSECPANRPLGALNCRQYQARDVTILELKGKLVEDEDRNELHSILRRLMRTGRNRFLLDMRSLDPFDGTALCSLLVDLVRVRANGGDIGLLYLQPAHRDLLVRTKTEDAFLIFADEQDAVHRLSAEVSSSNAPMRRDTWIATAA